MADSEDATGGGWSTWLQRLLGISSRRRRSVPPPPPAPTLEPPEPPPPLPDYPRGAYEPALFDAIRAAPDDPDRYAVLADWLTERDDPRGRLILAMRDGELPRGLLETYAGELYGPLHDAVREEVGPDEPVRSAHRVHWPEPERIVSVVAGWRHGFVDRLWVRPRFPDFDQAGPEPRAVTAFLDHPSCHVLRELTLGGAHLESLAIRGTFPTVRRLRVGDFDQGECNLAYSNLGEWGGVRDAFPNLEEVYLQGVIEDLTLPDGIRSLTLHANVVYGRVVREILARGAALRHLELWTGTNEYGGDVDLDDLTALAGLELQHLGLRNSYFTDAFVHWLVDTPVAGRLETLDLSLGTLTDAGAAVLVQRRDAFPRLKHLELDNNAIVDQKGALQHTWGVVLYLGDQDDEPYVSVAE